MAAKMEIGNVDSALEELGSYGKYSLVQFSLQAFAQVALIHHMLSIVFTGQKNPFRCPTADSYNRSEQGHTDEQYMRNSSFLNRDWFTYDGICYSVSGDTHDGLFLNTSSCNAYNVEYLFPKDRYFTSDFDLVCDREHLAALTQTLLTLGHATGSLAFPYFADNYGRKPVLLLCSFLWFCSSLGLAFSVSYTMLAVFKTLVGIFLQGVSQTSLTVMVEVLTSKQRGIMFGCLVCVIGTLSAMLMVPVAYILRNHSWRFLEMAYCSYFTYIILYVFFMDESLRWLAANGLQERVMGVLKRASRQNGRCLDNVVSAFYKDEVKTTPPYIKQDEASDSANVTFITDISTDNKPDDITANNGDETFIKNRHFHDEVTAEQKLNFFSLFKDRSLRFYTLFCTLAWFFNNLIFFALFLTSSTLSGSLYLNFFLNCVAELPAAIFVYFYIDKLGRKVCFATFSFTAGICLVGVAVSAAVSDQQSIVIKVLSIIGKLGITGSFTLLFIMTPELFPTNVRNTALGVASLSGCIGGMLAPFTELLMNKVVYAPGLIFGTGSLVLGVWSYFLPETANRQLPQSLKDVKNWSRERKTRLTIFKCCKPKKDAE